MQSEAVDITADFASCLDAMDFYEEALHNETESSFDSGDITNADSGEVLSYFRWEEDRKIGYNLYLWKQ